MLIESSARCAAYTRHTKKFNILFHVLWPGRNSVSLCVCRVCPMSLSLSVLYTCTIAEGVREREAEEEEEEAGARYYCQPHFFR